MPLPGVGILQHTTEVLVLRETRLVRWIRNLGHPVVEVLDLGNAADLLAEELPSAKHFEELSQRANHLALGRVGLPAAKLAHLAVADALAAALTHDKSN